MPAKLPERMAGVGTVMKLTLGVLWLIVFSKAKKKKILFLITGPPTLPPKSLKWIGVLARDAIKSKGAGIQCGVLEIVIPHAVELVCPALADLVVNDAAAADIAPKRPNRSSSLRRQSRKSGC